MSTLENADKGLINPKDKLTSLNLVNLPSLPTLLMEALQCTGESQSLANFIDKISLDQPMVIRILRIVNSPFYGMSKEINSLRQAVVLLGINRVRNMLLSVVFSKILPVRHKDFDYPLFLRHSMATANCAQQLAIYAGISQDIAFTSGLLHDIGKLIIVFLFPDDFSRMAKEPYPDSLATELRIIGFDHAEIGSRAAKHWNLPEVIQDAIGQHETPPIQGFGQTLSALIYTANLLTAEEESRDESGFWHQETIIQALNNLNIPIDQAKISVDGSWQFAHQIVTII